MLLFVMLQKHRNCLVNKIRRMTGAWSRTFRKAYVLDLVRISATPKAQMTATEFVFDPKQGIERT